MPLSWDREYDLPDDEMTEEEELLSQIIAHDVAAAGKIFMDTAGDFDPGDGNGDDDDDFDDDYIYVDDDDDGTNDDFDDEPEDEETTGYHPMIDGGTDSDDGDPNEIDDGYGDEAILPHGITFVRYVFITSLNE